jgi:2-oxo-3-hexenedioate decarboxylase
MSRIDAAAGKLFEAARRARPLVRFTAEDPDFSLEEGYRAQAKLLAMHLSAGEKLVGYKMGMTSEAKMRQMGLTAPIRGFLTDAMELGKTLSLRGRIHPKAEPEIAFVLGSDLRGAPEVEEALRAVREVCVAIEVIDSRFENFDFRLPDVVADNCSSSGFVLGALRVRPEGLDLTQVPIVLERNGRVEQVGSSAAILGHPGRSLAELARLLSLEGGHLPAGAVVLAGGATAAVRLEANDRIRVLAGALGEVGLEVEA